jgi:hypothetical protein
MHAEGILYSGISLLEKRRDIIIYAYSLRVGPIRTLPLLHFVIYAPIFGFMTILPDSL